jgi:hypothetical protein
MTGLMLFSHPVFAACDANIDMGTHTITNLNSDAATVFAVNDAVSKLYVDGKIAPTGTVVKKQLKRWLGPTTPLATSSNHQTIVGSQWTYTKRYSDSNIEVVLIFDHEFGASAATVPSGGVQNLSSIKLNGVNSYDVRHFSSGATGAGMRSSALSPVYTLRNGVNEATVDISLSVANPFSQIGVYDGVYIVTETRP